MTPPKIPLKPAQKFTVEAVGEFAYLDALKTVPAGAGTFELVPEPDNPYDNKAISIRYRDRVIAYIPAEKTKNYWQSVCKIITSGYIPVVEGEHQTIGQYGDEFHEIRLKLLSGTASLPDHFKTIKAVKIGDVPPAYSRQASVNRKATRSTAKPASSRSTTKKSTTTKSTSKKPPKPKKRKKKSKSLFAAFMKGVKKGKKGKLYW